ncbi:MAG: NAD-dependent epimerase/dehydratase family protein, partial [Candidatus Manganitrophaceae bacterium]
KIGIVGCGLNSDYHINFAKSYPGAEIVGLVDRDEKKLKECGEKHQIAGLFSSIKDLVEQKRPDVIHILTPPKTHFALAKEAIELNCNLLVEKPFTLNLQDAKALYDLAERRGVKLCTVHNHFFDPCMAKADNLIKKGELGKVINVESYYGLNTQIPAFRDYPAPNVLPWIYDLPGSVYHDFMPHPLYVLLEYTGRPKEVKVMTQTHAVLPNEMPDELRILINGEKAFGVLTFSFAAQPHLHFIRIYGTKMMVEVDINTMTTITHPKSALPKAAQKATYNLFESWQLLTSTFSNVYQFLTKKLKPYQGMKVLIHQFYDAIRQNGPVPVSKEQALVVLETMDEIFRQVKVKPFDFSPIIPKSVPSKHAEKILVTGGTGFVGKRLVEALVAEGYPVRVLARKLSNVEPLKKIGAEIFWGDVADKASLETALQGIDSVVHAAAGTSGNKKDCDLATIQGTLNTLALCERYKIRKLIYISSCSVYGVADYKKNEIVTETSSLERFPSKRGEYSASKQKAEALVSEAMKTGKVSAVILRPGTIWGPGGILFTPMMGFSLFGKAFVVIGNGRFELPFVYIDNLVDAIIKSIQSDQADQQIFNVIDSERLNKREYMRTVIKPLYPKARVFYFPFGLLYSVVWMQEKMLAALKRNPFLTRYRLTSSQKHISYDNAKLVRTLHWKPKVGLSEAVEQVLRHERSKD